jgi:hypothetical protein
VDLDVRVAHQQRLRVGVHRDELDAAKARIDHAVDRVGAAAADADDLDDGEVVAALVPHGPLLTSGEAPLRPRAGRAGGNATSPAGAPEGDPARARRRER